MPSNNNRINFQVGYNVDQASVNAVKKSLQDLQNIKMKDFSGPKKQLDQIKETAGKVQAALTKAFNVNLNSLNTKAFNTALNQAGLNIDKIYSQFSKAGAQGQVAFSRMASSVLTTNLQLKQTNSLISQMGETMANTVKWGIASSIMNSFSNSVQQAFNYVKNLDSALTDIRIVTGDSTEQMKQFAQEANNAAQSLGRSTMDYTKAALTFYQQGLSEEDVQVRTQTVLKAQNITGAGEQMADYLTAVWNGYKVANEEAELYVDKLAAVADSSASNMSQLAVAMSKVASTANMLGVPVDSLNAQIATIVATTRQAPESVGNALKTIYSRINDIATGADDAQISLGNYSSKMAEVGINVLDANGKLRDTGDVIDEIGGKWETLSREQQIYLARTMAGQRQYNNLLALFENWGKYTDLVNVSLDAQGTTMQKNAIYMESLGAKLEQLGAAGEKVKSALINEEDLKGLVNLGTGIVNLFGNLIESIGGGRGALLAFGSVFTQVFSGTITKELNNIITNFQNIKNNAQILKQDIASTQLLGKSQGYKDGTITSMVEAKRAAQEYYDFMSNTQKNQYNEIVKQIGVSQEKVLILNQQVQQAKKFEKAIKQDTVAVIDEKDALKDILNSFSGKEGLVNLGQKENFELLKSQIEELKSTVDSSAIPAFNRFEQAINSIKDPANATAEQLREVRTAAEQIVNQTDTKINLVLALDQTSIQAKEASASLQLAQQAANNYLESIKQFANVKSIVDAASAFGRLASGLNSLANLKNIWSNQSLSSGQKLLQTMTNLGMAIPMLVSSFKTLKTVTSAWSTTLDITGKIQAAQTAATSAQTVVESAHAKVVMLEAKAAEYKQRVDAGEVGLKPLLISTTNALTAARSAETAATTTATAAQEALNVAMKANPIGLIVTGVAAAVAALYGLVKVYDYFTLSVKEANEALEAYHQKQSQLLSKDQTVRQQTSELEALKDEYEELAQKAGAINFDNTIENLTQAERSRYNEIKNLIAQYNEDAIAGYNDQGQAILKKNNALEQTIKLIKEQHQAQIDEYLDSKEYQDAVKGQKVTVEELKDTGREEIQQRKQNWSDSFNYNMDTLRGQILQHSYQPDDYSNQINALLRIQEGGIQNLSNNKERLENLINFISSMADDNQDYLLQAQIDNLQSYVQNLIDIAGQVQQIEFDEQKLEQQIIQKSKIDIKDILFALKGSDNNEQYNQLAEVYGETLLNDLIRSYAEGFNNGEGFNLDNVEDRNQAILKVREYLSSLITGTQLTKQDINSLTKEATNFSIDNDFADKSISEYQGAIRQLIEKVINENDKLRQLAKDNPEELSNIISSIFGVQNLKIKFDSHSGDVVVQELTGQYKELYDKAVKELQSSGIFEGQELEFTKEWLRVSADTSTLQNFTQFLHQLGLTAGETGERLLEAAQNMAKVNEESAKVSLSPEEAYKNIHDVVDNLQTGDTIDLDQAAKLEQAGVSLDGFFTHAADGTLKLEGDAKDFYDYANNQSIQGFKDQIQQLQVEIGAKLRFEDESQYSASNGGKFSEFSANAYEGNQRNNQLLYQQLNFLQAIGEQNETIQKVITEITNGEQVQADQVRVISNLVNEHKDEWTGNKEKIDENINQLNIYNQELANALELAESLSKQLDPDVDEDQWKDLSDYLNEYGEQLQGVSEHVEEHRQAAEELAQAMLRYDHALEEVIDHYDDWESALTSGSIQDAVQAGNELQNVYSDLLDLPYESLSPDFTQSIDNLHLLQEAANGSEEAYAQLQERAGQDILAQVGIDTSQFYVDRDNIYNELNNLTGQQWDDIQIGANLDTGNFLQSLSDMVTAAGMTADQATDYLSSMGIDAEVKEHDTTATEQQEQIGYKPVATGPAEFTSAVSYFGPDGQIRTGTVHYAAQGYSYEPIMVPATATKENKAFSLEVTSAHKKSGGGFKFSNASHGGGSKAPRSSGGGGKGKGGGGGKSPKAATPKKATVQKQQTLSEAKDSINDRSDVYHDINLALEKQEDKLDDIQDKQKKLVNKDRLKNLQQQNKQLEKQKDLLDQKSGIAASELVRLRNEIVDDLGDGIKFDKNGQIANYNAALDKARDNYNNSIADYNKKVADAENAYNRYVAQYNSMSGDAQEANKQNLEHQKDVMDQIKKQAQKTLEKEKEKYDAIKDNVKEYEDTLKLQREIADKQQEIQDKIYENLIAMSKIKVDLSIDTGDFERDWLDFENKFIKKLDKDDFLGSAKASAKELMSYFNSKQVQQTADQIRKIRNQINIMNRGGTSNIYGTNLAQAKEDLEDYMKQQMDDLQDIQDKIDDIKENYLDAIDDAKDKMDDQIDQYERVNDLVEHNMKMVELLYGDKAYDSMQKYYGLQQENNERELESLKKQQDYWKQKMDNEVVGSDAWQKFKDNLDDVTDDLNNKLEDMIDNLSDRWENRVDGIIARLNNALTGGRGLDYLDEQWDYINNYDDQFLDTFESKTGIDEVERLYQSTIDGLSGSPKSQQALNKLMNDQLKLLREKDHLTEYDLERAKASLEVQKARLALEQARDNKTKMRLRRDSQGNYTYQYVADEEKLGELQAALADAQANLYETDKDHYKQNLNNLYDTYKEYIEKMRDLTEEYNNTQDAEERKRIQSRMDLLKESTNKLMSGLTQDNKYLLQYLNGSFFDGMGVDTSTLTMEEQMEIMEQNIPQMQSNIQDLSNTIVGQGGILPATADMMKEINEATIQYDKDVQSMLNSAGTSLQTIQQATDAQGVALDKNITDAQNLITANDELIKSCQAQIEAMEKLLDYMDKYINKIMSVQTLLSNLRSAYNTGQGLNGSNLTADNIGMTDWGMDTTGGMEYTGNPKTDAAAIKQQIDALMAQYEKFLAGMSIAAFDTGGYTGSWGDAEGRLAFLHQGELVLNQDDTQNILNAVQVVRGMANAINSFASGEINSLMSGANGLLTGISNTEHLDQNVHIEANFPNVTQHTEIEQAFNNLVNMASMRASGYRD